MAADYPGMRPKMLCKVGDRVKRGQPLFEDRKAAGVIYTAPGAGQVVGINRGEYRALISVVIELTESEAAGEPSDDDFATFSSYEGKAIDKLEPSEISALLTESGMRTAFRQRPFDRVPSTEAARPAALFVTASDSHPLALDPAIVLQDEDAAEAFADGLKVIATLCEGTTYVCKAQGAEIPTGGAKVQVEEFAGPHPSGTVGFHIHTLFPVSRQRSAWHLNYQDVISIGRLFKTGKLDVSRMVSLAGPGIRTPGLVRTRVGAEIDGLLRPKELLNWESRVVSGSVLWGRIAMGEEHGFLGRYHLQITALEEGRKRELLGWLKPGFDLFSITRTFASKLMPDLKFNFDTNLNGSPRAMVPIGMFEEIFPFDIFPTFLLRAILMRDLSRAEELGVLELAEEDLALCTYVAPGKHDFGAALRANLDEIWKEG